MLGVDLDARSAHQYLQVFTLFRKHQGDDIAGVTGACRATRAVQVCLMVGRRIHMHDKVHSVDVHATSGDVCGDEDSRLAGGESRQVTVARGLRKVAVQVD